MADTITPPKTVSLGVYERKDTFEYRAAREYLGLIKGGMDPKEARPLAVALARIELSRKHTC